MYYWFFNYTTCEEYRVPMVPGRDPESAVYFLRFLGYIAINDQFKYLGLVS